MEVWREVADGDHFVVGTCGASMGWAVGSIPTQPGLGCPMFGVGTFTQGPRYNQAPMRLCVACLTCGVGDSGAFVYEIKRGDDQPVTIGRLLGAIVGVGFCGALDIAYISPVWTWPGDLQFPM